MKLPAHFKNFATISLFAAFCFAVGVHADDISADNITIQQAALFGSVFTNAEATASVEGLRIDTSQATAEVYRTSITPGYYNETYVTVEDWGWVTTGGGHTEYITEWQIVGYDTIPATYDENNIEITPESYEPRYDWVITGSYWLTDPSVWAVTGTHQEYQQTWVPEQINSWTETTSGGVPRVRFNATRSDTNFVFRVPSPSGPEGMKDILVLWEGGMSLPNDDPARTNVLTAGSLQQSWVQASSGYNQQTSSNIRAEVSTLTTNVQRLEAGVWHYESSENESRPESLRLTRTENSNSGQTVAQTQISANSAKFAGSMEVAGDAKVSGALLIQPRGDLTMGIYTSGPQP